MFASVFTEVCDVCYRFHEGLQCLLTFSRRFVINIYPVSFNVIAVNLLQIHYIAFQMS